MLVHKFKAIQLSVCRNLVYEVSEKKKNHKKTQNWSQKLFVKRIMWAYTGLL